MNIQRLRVPIGFAFGAIYIYLSTPSPALLILGVSVAAVGLGLRIWAAGHLQKFVRLATSGPYRWTRNPLYLGSLILGSGFMIASAHPILLIAFVVLFFGVYVPVMRREEKELQSAYGLDYEQYRDRVPLFVPLPGKNLGHRESTGGTFLWTNVANNREYKAVLGFTLLTAFLYLKMVWL
jgi:protein-S-isoprenylcysteine O-methyltransferase Ste14